MQQRGLPVAFWLTRSLIGDVAIRDHGLLASAAERPQSSVFGEDVSRVFCLLNGRDLAFGVDDAEQLVLAGARGGQAA
jgi:hypothetical protein